MTSLTPLLCSPHPFKTFHPFNHLTPSNTSPISRPSDPVNNLKFDNSVTNGDEGIECGTPGFLRGLFGTEHDLYYHRRHKLHQLRSLGRGKVLGLVSRVLGLVSRVLGRVLGLVSRVIVKAES